MNIFDRFRNWVGSGVKAALVNMIQLTPAWARYAFMQTTFRNLVVEGYKGNGMVFGCISALAFAFPEPPMLVWEEKDGGGKIPLRSHALSRLLRRPNPQMGLADLLRYTVVYMAVGGSAYWYKVRARNGLVKELWPLHDGQITPVAGGTKLIDHYEFDNGSGGKPDIIPYEDIVQFPWMPDPLAPWKGLAPLLAVAREVDTDNEATRYLFSLLKNDATPRLAIVAKDDAALADDDVRKRLKAEWGQEHGGENRGKVALLEGGLDIRTIALNLKELEFNLLRFVPEARICSAFRVPVAVAGAYVGLDKATYNNQGQQFEFFTDRTLVPLWGMIDDKVASDLLPEFSGRENEIVEFDLDKVQVLAEKKAAARQWAVDGLKSGGVLVNEFRSVFGLPMGANDNVYLRTMAMTEVPFEPMRGQGTGPLREAQGAGSKGQGAEGKGKNRRRAQESIISAQRTVRREVAGRMEAALENYFGGLADRVIHRARKGFDKVTGGQGDGVIAEAKALPRAEDLLTDGDEAELEQVIKRFYVEIIQASWGYFDLALGVEAVLDLTDPIVTDILGDAGTRVKQITETTLEELRTLLKYGSEQGWSIEHLVRGDPENGVRGLRDIVEETYKNRAKTIARTEMGNAQNKAAMGRYADAGVTKVFVMDNGLDDDDDACKAVNGQVKALKWAEENPLEHPNCTRAFAPEF